MAAGCWLPCLPSTTVHMSNVERGTESNINVVE